MISFFSFLIESKERIDFIKNQPHNQNISMAHDDHGRASLKLITLHKNNPAAYSGLGVDASKLTNHSEPTDIERSHYVVDTLASHDPSHNHKYTDWMVRQYKQGHIRLEDGPRVKETLSNFEKHRSKLPNKDINSYKHISHVEDAIEPHLGTLSGKEQKRVTKHEGADLIHSENGVTVHRLKTKEAACHYGKGTKWCTAADNDEHNMFNHYHKQGPLYVVQTHGPNPDLKGLSPHETKHHAQTVNRKYQFHFQSGQFMDEKDRPINVDNLVNRHPELKNVKEFRGHGLESFPFMDHKEIDASISHHLSDTFGGNDDEKYSISRYIAGKPELHHHYEAMASHPNVVWNRAAAYNGPEHIKAKLINHPDEYVREHIALSTEDPAKTEALAKQDSSYNGIHQELIYNSHTSPKALATIAMTNKHAKISDQANFAHFKKTGKAVKTTTGDPAHPPGSEAHYTGMRNYSETIARFEAHREQHKLMASKGSRSSQEIIHPDSEDSKRAAYYAQRKKHMANEFKNVYPGIVKIRQESYNEEMAKVNNSGYAHKRWVTKPKVADILKPHKAIGGEYGFYSAVEKGYHKPSQ